MKKFLCGMVSALILTPALHAQAGTPENSDYPEFYVTGQNLSGWQFDEQYKMQRAGNTYSILLSSLSGEFKISNRGWEINFGATSPDFMITGATTVDGIKDGFNYVAPGTLENVTVSLMYNPEDSFRASISFALNGDNPVRPGNGISGTLPVLYINVYDENGNLNNEIISKDLDHKNYFSGEYWLDVNGCEWMMAEGAESIGSAESPLPLEIKARGNWTRKGFSKKPFKLKLGKKQSMLGLSKSKHFAILAHADDGFGYLRNFTGFNLGRRIGLPWTPDQQPVEVIINNDYRGLYFLTESIRVDSDRVDINELNDGETDPSLLSGGYLIELDNYDEDYESQIQMQEKGQYPGFKDMLRITFDTPEVYSDLQRQFINQQFSKMNDLVGENSDELWSYIDLDDVARYYLICELVSHVEAFHGSTYMFRDRGADQKWHFSPLWDFGNAFNGPSDGYIYDHAPYGMTWVGSFSMNDMFSEKVRETWKWFMTNGFNGIYDDMALVTGHLEAAAIADHNRWDNQPEPWGGTSVVDNSDMQSRLRAAREHLERKVEWLKNQFGDYSGGSYSEPERDTTPAAPLPEFISTGIAPVTAIASSDEIVFYNMQGHRIDNPVAGEIYIAVGPSDVRKVMVK